jgi:FkbM family methyltransferase
MPLLFEARMRAGLRELFHSQRGLVANHRKNPLVKKVARLCSIVHSWYENLDGNPDTNGEYEVLRRLEGARFETIFDVGANVGEWSLAAHAVFPSAMIHAFEIVPQTCEMLRRNTALIPEIIVNEFGLSNKLDGVDINFYPDHPELATLTNYPHAYEHRVIQGSVKKGDTYVSDSHLDQIDFIKMDVEGAEHLVLDGLRSTIEQGKISVFQFEYGRVNILTKFLLKDHYDFFRSRGYVVGKIYPNYVEFRDYKLDHEDFIGQNYLAVSEKHSDWIEVLGS